MRATFRLLAPALVFLLWCAPARGQTTLPPESADWIVEGEQPTGTFGFWVASAGDVDGDGFDDVLAGDPYYSGAYTRSGRITFYRGSPGGPATTPTWLVEGTQPDAGLYVAVPAGDVNGDGYDDVVVRAEPGRVLSLYVGSPTGPAPTSWAIPGITAETGDINADGFADLAVLSTYTEILIFHGSAAGLAQSPSRTLMVSSERSDPLLDLAYEDVNGDGYDDLAFTWWSVQRKSSLLATELTVYTGSADGLEPLGKRRIVFKEKLKNQTAYVAGAGDVDGDGYGDLAVTLYGEGPQEVFWLRGGRTGPSSQLLPIATSPLRLLAKDSVHGLGDFNRDGYPDLVVPYADSFSRSLRIFAGSPGGYLEVPVLTVEPAEASVSATGDVNGDGLGDLIAGERGFGNGMQGRVYVFLGRASP